MDDDGAVPGPSKRKEDLVASVIKELTQQPVDAGGGGAKGAKGKVAATGHKERKHDEKRDKREKGGKKATAKAAEATKHEEAKKVDLRQCRLGLIIGQQIGSGSFAKVYKAFSCQRQKDVAVKIFKRSEIPENYFNKFIVREIEVIKELRHPNLVKFYDCQFTTKRIFLVMEYCSQGSLLDFLTTAGTISEKLAKEYFRQLIDAIEYCHVRGIVHRDIKCENLLFDGNFVLKLVDFGFARKFKKGELLQTFCGSYAYASPEILKQRPYKPQPVDLWACGVVLYVMIFGKLPFRNSRLKTLFKHERMRARDMDQKPRISIECQWMIMKILSPVDHRYKIKDIKNDAWLAAATTTPNEVPPTNANNNPNHHHS